MKIQNRNISLFFELIQVIPHKRKDLHWSIKVSWRLATSGFDSPTDWLDKRQLLIICLLFSVREYIDESSNQQAIR